MVDINSELQMVDVSTEQEQVSLEEVPLEQQMEVESQNVEGEAVDGVQANEEVEYLNSPQTPTQDEPVVELEGKDCLFADEYFICHSLFELKHMSSHVQ